MHLKLFLSNEITALVATEYIGQPVAFEAIDDILLNSEDAIMDEIEILEKSDFIGHTLNSTNITKFNLTLIGIMNASNKNEFIFNPKKEHIYH